MTLGDKEQQLLLHTARLVGASFPLGSPQRNALLSMINGIDPRFNDQFPAPDTFHQTPIKAGPSFSVRMTVDCPYGANTGWLAGNLNTMLKTIDIKIERIEISYD